MPQVWYLHTRAIFVLPQPDLQNFKGSNTSCGTVVKINDHSSNMDQCYYCKHVKLNVDKFKIKKNINCRWAGKIKASERCSKSSVISFPLLAAVLKLKPQLHASCWECHIIDWDSYTLCIQPPSYQFSKSLKRLKYSVAVPASFSLSHNPRRI